MKKHFKKIKEWFAGIWKDSIKYCKTAIKKLVPKIKTSFQKIHKSVGITGRIMIGAVIVIWILLAYYTNKANIYQQKNQIWNFENIVIQKWHKRFHLGQTMKDYKTSQNISYTIKNGKISWYFESSDRNAREKVAAQLQNLGLSVEQKDNQILFQGNLSSQLPLLQILN